VGCTVCTVALSIRPICTARTDGPYRAEKALHAMLFSVRAACTGRLYGCVTGVYGCSVHTTRAHKARLYGPRARVVWTVDRAPVHTRIDGPYERSVQTGAGTGRQYWILDSIVEHCLPTIRRIECPRARSHLLKICRAMPRAISSFFCIIKCAHAIL